VEAAGVVACVPPFRMRNGGWAGMQRPRAGKNTESIHGRAGVRATPVYGGNQDQLELLQGVITPNLPARVA
jgi:hypothetical protein